MGKKSRLKFAAVNEIINLAEIFYVVNDRCLTYCDCADIITLGNVTEILQIVNSKCNRCNAHDRVAKANADRCVADQTREDEHKL